MESRLRHCYGGAPPPLLADPLLAGLILVCCKSNKRSSYVLLLQNFPALNRLKNGQAANQIIPKMQTCHASWVMLHSNKASSIACVQTNSVLVKPWPHQKRVRLRGFVLFCFFFLASQNETRHHSAATQTHLVWPPQENLPAQTNRVAAPRTHCELECTR